MKRTKNSAIIESTEGCVIPFEGGRTIRDCIFTVRGVQVMVDWDLAALYGVETRVMNQAVKRNEDRFPERFRFRLSQQEMDELITNCDKSGRLKHYPGLPYVFTEQGIAMLASVLRSVTAIAVSVRMMDAFVEMRRTLAALVPVTQMLKDLQQKQLLDQAKNDERFAQIFTDYLAVRYNESFHDRFLIVDDKELYLIGASLKDLGKKCFGFTKMDAGEIERIKKAAFGTA